MRPLSAAELLEVWERGLTQAPIERALALVAAACAVAPAEVARLSVGQRDAQLLTLREWAFGARVAALELCPHCGERLELNFDIADVRAEAVGQTAETEPLQIAGYELRCRAVNSLDLLALSGERDPARARRLLLERCLTELARDGAPISPAQLPEEAVSALAARLQQADPQANVQLALVCPHCEQSWQAEFDIGSFFWDELHVWAPRLLREVHMLASAYGWREPDILALSPWRRQFYLDCIGK